MSGSFGRVDGQLAPGLIPVERLAARVGSTPFFAYDRTLLTARVAAVRSLLPDRIQLSYAVKANPMPALVQHLSGLVDGFDVASGLELRTALDTPVPPARVSFAVGADLDTRRGGLVARPQPDAPGGQAVVLGAGEVLEVRP